MPRLRGCVLCIWGTDKWGSEFCWNIAVSSFCQDRFWAEAGMAISSPPGLRRMSFSVSTIQTCSSKPPSPCPPIYPPSTWEPGGQGHGSQQTRPQPGPGHLHEPLDATRFSGAPRLNIPHSRRPAEVRTGRESERGRSGMSKGGPRQSSEQQAKPRTKKFM